MLGRSVVRWRSSPSSETSASRLGDNLQQLRAVVVTVAGTERC
jgi:hypothetical protein